jgi:hypothetical protein
MTRDEWLAKVLADRPPLTQAQIAVLRPIFAPVIPHIKAASVTATEAAQNRITEPQEPLKGTSNA